MKVFKSDKSVKIHLEKIRTCKSGLIKCKKRIILLSGESGKAEKIDKKRREIRRREAR